MLQPAGTVALPGQPALPVVASRLAAACTASPPAGVTSTLSSSSFPSPCISPAILFTDKKKSKMSKFPDDEDLPPPYTLPAEPSHYVPPPQTHLFASHLTTLRSGISSAQAARTSARNQTDNVMLSMLIPHVEELLSSIASISPSPSLVEATLVPSAAVDSTWAPTDHDEKRDGEYYSVIRVGRPGKEAPIDDKRSLQTALRSSAQVDPNRAFGDWGRFEEDNIDTGPSADESLWWKDEDMAARLARHLQPQRPIIAVDRQTVAERARRPSRWNLFGGRLPGDTPPVATGSTTSQASIRRVEHEDITMKVVPREVTFRKENDFGIWESNRGWGLVVQVRVRIRKS